ncbi:ComF family protein [Neisseria perflava]|uniref:ComF family protein n=1 Tax=Neisseria perflava TaxID=33053 RepID=UPI0020A0971B|nr:ComF family protein [Neisseria perflava]MCP1772517.1 ComF family protein [Neisseria perflava]
MDILTLWRKLKSIRARQCVLCHDSAAGVSDGLCAGCMDDLAAHFTDAANCCPLCFRRVAGGAVCGQCQQKPPPFRRLWASAYYEAPVSSMIHEFKHLADLSLCRPLADIMIRHAPDWLAAERIDCVLPMPLSKERRLYRGFNQSEELAAVLARHYGWTVLPRDTLERIDKPPQSTLKSDERQRNVRNIFKIKKTLPQNCNILLIDDVFTTGATLGELARTLKTSGAAQIFCWTLARSRLKS